jgi:peptidoglycan/xylan/chitin deacetylase (PgdA/CDA1 family)
VIRVAPAAVAFGVPAIAVVLISTAVTLHGRDATATRPQPPRFSGSTVVQRLPSLLASPKLPGAVPVVVVRDDAAATFYDSPAKLDSIVGAWRDALAASGASVRVLSSAAAHADKAARVVVVPSSPCLTLDTRETIEDAWSRGAGVILTGMAGTYDGGCRPLGYGLIIGATGAARAEPLEKREMAYVTLPSTSPLSLEIPPGARLDLNPGRQIALRHVARDGFYSDYSLQPQPAHSEPLLDAAMTHAEVNGRRVVYLGFELTDIVHTPWNRAIARLLVRNSVAWAAALPFATIEPWPDGNHAAASIAQDVETGFANARHAADSLHAAGVRSTFYLTTQLAQRYERLSRHLAQSNEIGTHSQMHFRLGGLPPAEQRQRLAATQQDLKEIIGTAANGLRPPEEQFDTATMSAWLASKGSYIFGANDSRAAAPELLRIGRDTLVLVGRVVSDDFAGVAKHFATTDALADVFLDEYERVRALGGHYVLSYHSQVLARPDLVPSLALIARRLAADTSVWVAPVGDVAQWWRDRARLDVRTRVAGDVMKVVVRNRNDHTVRGAVVRVSLPDAKRVAHADARQLPVTTPTARLVIPQLAAHASRTLTITLAPAR